MTSVVTGLPRRACSFADAARAASSCAPVSAKMALRYWSPMSGPWRFFVVGSWFMKKTRRRSS